MIDIQVQNEIAKFRDYRETFTIIDTDGLGKMDVMIVGIKYYEKRDDLVKIIDMGDFYESFDVCDYEIGLKDLIKARRKYLDEAKFK